MTIDSPILATLEAENARLLARVTELEGGMREQVAFCAMELTCLRGHADDARIADIEFRRDRALAALTPTKT